jgi:Uncharacterized conserved protein
MLDAIDRISDYVGDTDRATFDAEPMVQDAVIRQLEIIGEASRQLSDDFRDRYDTIPWHAVIGMRNRIAHDYLNVDLDIVWEVVQYDLPDLREHIREILDE